MPTGIIPIDGLFGDTDGRITVFRSQPGNGKTFLLSFMAAKILSAGRDVCWIGDYQDGGQAVPRRISEYCRAFGVTGGASVRPPRMSILSPHDFEMGAHLHGTGDFVLFIDNFDFLRRTSMDDGLAANARWMTRAMQYIQRRRCTTFLSINCRPIDGDPGRDTARSMSGPLSMTYVPDNIGLLTLSRRGSVMMNQIPSIRIYSIKSRTSEPGREVAVDLSSLDGVAPNPVVCDLGGWNQPIPVKKLTLEEQMEQFVSLAVAAIKMDKGYPPLITDEDLRGFYG